MNECEYLVDARYVGDYKVQVKFNTGESGVVDLEGLVFSEEAARPLRDKMEFEAFYLDSWPTLAWRCGFDVAPETLYEMCRHESPVVAEDEVEYGGP